MSAEHSLPPADEAPPVRTDGDLLDRWRQLMGPWGFGSTALWLAWFDADDIQLPVVVPIEELPAGPDPDQVQQLLPVLRQAQDAIGAAWLSMALARPGSGLITPSDRAWAYQLRPQRLAEHSIVSRPLFLATEGRVRQLALDDL